MRPFAIQNGQPALLLAPMEGVTDAPMRALMSELGGFTHLVTEFLRVSQAVLSKKSIARHAVELSHGSRTPHGTPVILQLLGGNPERLALSALAAVEMGAKAIDLNFGCPAPTVNSHDGGATLLKYPERIEAIVRAVREALPGEIPVSAKLRLGWDSAKPIFENAKRAEQGGASWITIHGRTKMQGYMPPAYWGPIGEVRQRLSIPVIANGDLWTLEDFRACREQTGCEHFMLGRGALANPFLAHTVARELGLKTPATPTRPRAEDWQSLLHRFLAISAPLSDNPHYALRRVKQWLRYAAKHADFIDFDLVKVLENEGALRATIPALRFGTPALAAPFESAL